MATIIKITKSVHAARARADNRVVIAEHSLDLHEQIIIKAGYWLAEPHQQQRYNVYFHALSRFALFIASLVVISQIVDGLSNISNMEFLTENLYVCLIFIMSIAKTLTVMLKPNAIKRLFGRLKAMKRDDAIALPEERRLFSHHREVSQRLTIGFCIVAGVTSSGFALIPVADQESVVRILPYRMWTPFNHTTTPNYEMMYGALSVMAVFAGLTIGVFDTLFASLMIATIGQLKILQYKLSNLRAIAQLNVEREREARYSSTPDERRHEDNGTPHETGEQPRPSPVQVVVTRAPVSALYRRIKPVTYDRIVVGSQVAAKKFVLDVNLLFGDKVASYQQSTLNPRDSNASQSVECVHHAEEVDAEMQNCLGECVDHHVAIINFIDDLESVFWGTLVIQIMTSLGICVVVYQATRASYVNVKVVVMLMVVFAGVVQLFMYCWFSSVITHESSNLNEAMYHFDWLHASPSLKRSMQIVMCQTELCPQLKVAGFVPLSLVMFRKVLKQTYSFYSLITGLDSGIASAINDLGI